MDKKKWVSGWSFITVLLVIAVASPAFGAYEAETDSIPFDGQIQWKALEALPDSIGVAGAFIGKHNGALIVAGGANFPNGYPWQGGKKAYQSQIYVMTKQNGRYQWYSREQLKLPHPLAYGVAISTPHGIVIIGGTDGKKVYDDVFLLQWNPTEKKIQIRGLPDLPVPLAFMTGAKIGSTIYIAGGQQQLQNARSTRHFFSLNIATLGHSLTTAWQRLPSWPGPSRILAVSAVQNDGVDEVFYIFSGRKIDPEKGVKILKDGYSYNPETKEWKSLGAIHLSKDDSSASFSVMGAAAVPYGESHILVFGGDRGKALQKRLTLTKQINKLKAYIASHDGGQLGDSLTALQNKLLHITKYESGFSNKVLAYHTITNSWVVVGQMPGPSPVTTSAVKLDGRIIIPSGEVRPGVRTDNVYTAAVSTQVPGFGWFNYSVVGLYFLLMIVIGIYFIRRENAADDFFLAGQRIPWWAAGLSIYATQLSAITFIAVPAVAYATNWEVLISYLTILMMVPIVIEYYLPFFRRLNVTTAYQYLERRFNVAVRVFSSVSYILFELARTTILLLLPAMAITAIIGLNIYLAIILMGVITITYTTMGGMEAVVWTDVLQAFIFIAAILYTLIVIVVQVGGVDVIYQVAIQSDKLQMFDWRFSFTDLVTWSIFFGSFALQFGPYTADQSVVQRYLTTRNEKEARKSLWTNGIISIPTGFLFFALGTCLYVFYKLNPSLVSLGMQTDEIYPLFIGQQLPVGFAGLVIAGIFSASMSSLSSSIHSISTAFSVDFFDRFRPGSTEKQRVARGRIMVIIVGLFGTILSCWLASREVISLYFFFQEVLGLLASALAGIFMLGIFTESATAKGTLAGAITSILCMVFVDFFTPLHFYIFPLIGIPVCVIVGYLVSQVTESEKKDLSGLTYRNLTSDEEDGPH